MNIKRENVALRKTLSDAIEIVRGYESATFWQRLKYLFTGEI